MEKVYIKSDMFILPAKMKVNTKPKGQKQSAPTREARSNALFLRPEQGQVKVEVMKVFPLLQFVQQRKKNQQQNKLRPARTIFLIYHNMVLCL